MNKQEILESNKIVAEFMEWQHHEDKEYDEYEMSSLKYQSSWDLLKPAIDKFLNIDITEFDYHVTHLTEFRQIRASLANMTNQHSIQDFYKKLIESIKWYNKNK
jgi:hypothetical protein